MKILASLYSIRGDHQVKVESKGISKVLNIESGINGLGSSINGGEFLFLAIATCFCNDLYREAGKIGIEIDKVEVEVTGDFNAEGAAGSNIQYKVKLEGKASDEELNRLIIITDRVTEIQNTLRKGVEVTLIN